MHLLAFRDQGFACSDPVVGGALPAVNIELEIV